MLRQGGFSLTELMVGTLVGLVVLAGALHLYSATAAAGADNLRMARLSHELRALEGLIRADLRRAGFWAFRPGIEKPGDNPFMRPPHALRIGQALGETADSCILYSYDRNGDGRVGVGRQGRPGPRHAVDHVEEFGLRLHRGSVQIRTGGQPFDCDGGQWQDLTGADTLVEQLRFRLTESCLNAASPGQPCRGQRPVQIVRTLRFRIQARSRSDPAIRQTVASLVHVRNNRYLPGP